jgi:hypothetical protein
MRPARFQDFVLDLVKNTPGVTSVQTLTEAGSTSYPYGLAVTTSAGEARWQILGQLASGEKHTDPDLPVKGEPLPPGPNPAVGDSAEGWLAAVITNTRCPEIASVDRWSTQAGKQPRHGLTIDFHNGARAFVRQIAAH